MKALLLLGSTGSIGTQTLDLVRRSPGAFTVLGLSAQRSIALLREQIEEFQPRFVAVADPTAAEELRPYLPPEVTLFAGTDALEEIATECPCDLVVHGVVGAAGVIASQRTLERGVPLALANKESLVVAGEHLMELSRRHDAPILPVDSEHAAIYQCLRGERLDRVRCIHITASGGPFRDLDPAELAHVTPAQALKHPNWDMGPRITVGSATLMNKALEVIEAHHLFGLAPEQIRVTVHRQSIVHSMVEFVDGSVMAQMGPPDMRGPIHFALHHPDRAPADLTGFDLALFSQLTFEAPDPSRFPSLELGYECIRAGGDAGAVLNASDEVVVAAFLDGQIAFQEICQINRRVLEQRPGLSHSVGALLEADRVARDLAAAAIAQRVPGA